MPAADREGAQPPTSGRFGPVADLRLELSAGLTTALVSLPQNMAHGLIAFQPLGAEWATTGLLAGMLSAVFVGLASCLMGSSPVLVSGPRVAGALVFSTLLGQLLGHGVAGGALGVEQALVYAFLAVLLSGLIQVGFGLTRLGNLVKYVPFPVMAGFLTASGLLVVLSQFLALTGLPQAGLDGATYMPFAFACGVALVALRLPSRLVGVPSLALVLVLGSVLYHVAAQWPGALPLLGGTLAKMPASLPEPALLTRGLDTLFSWQTLQVLPLVLIAALSIAAVSSLDTLLTMVAVDNLTLGRADENRELVAQGVGNSVAGLFFGIPGSGSMTRTLPLLNAGGSSQIANLVCVVLSALCVMLLPPFIGLLPQVVMGGILLVLGVQLLDRWSLGLLTRAFRRDGRLPLAAGNDLLIVALVVLVALAWNLITAVAVGVLLSAVVFIKKMSHSLVRRSYSGVNVRARRFTGTRAARLLEAHGQRIRVLELEGAIFFGSADNLERRIEQLVDAGVTHFVFDMKRISEIDTSGAKVLQRIYQRLRMRGRYVAISYLQKERRRRELDFTGSERRRQASVRRLWLTLEQLGIVARIGEETFWPDTDSALGACEADLLRELQPGDESAAAGFGGGAAILHGLDRGDLRRLRPLLRRVRYAPGEAIFAQGDDGDAVYFLARGAADVLLDLAGTERRKRVLTLLPGAVFGEMAILDRKPRAASVVATAPTRCYRMGREAFHDLQAMQPELAFQLMTNVCLLFVGRLRDANQMIIELEI